MKIQKTSAANKIQRTRSPSAWPAGTSYFARAGGTTGVAAVATAWTRFVVACNAWTWAAWVLAATWLDGAA